MQETFDSWLKSRKLLFTTRFEKRCRRIAVILLLRRFDSLVQLPFVMWLLSKFIKKNFQMQPLLYAFLLCVCVCVCVCVCEWCNAIWYNEQWAVSNSTESTTFRVTNNTSTCGIPLNWMSKCALYSTSIQKLNNLCQVRR